MAGYKNVQSILVTRWHAKTFRPDQTLSKKRQSLIVLLKLPTGKMIFGHANQMSDLPWFRILMFLHPSAKRPDRLQVTAGSDQQVFIFASITFWLKNDVQQTIIGGDMPACQRIGRVKVKPCRAQ